MTLAAFYGAGSLLCLITGLTPGWAANGQPAALGTAVLTFAVTCWLLLRRSISLAAARVLLVTGTVIITALTGLSGGGVASVSYAMFTIWITTYAFLFFPARTAWWQSNVALTAVTIAQLSVYPPSVAGTNAAMVAGVVLTAGIVTNKLVQRLTHVADTDPLTGLLTEYGLSRGGWQTKAPAQALILFEIRNMPSIRAAVGVAGRDELTQALARRLRHAVDDTATVARLPGEIFAVTAASPASVEHVDAIREQLEGRYRIQGLEIDVSVIAGLSHADDTTGEEPFAMLLIRATQALTAAAREDRDVRHWSSELGVDATAEISLGADLRRGISAGELVLLYQPQFDAHSGVMTGAEALVRWQHPDRGLLAPAVFLSIAETGPLIVDLTYWVLDDAIGQAALWHHTGRELPISVNLSPRLLVHQGLTDHVRNLLAQHGLPARLLTLEVTETAVLTQPERSRDVLTELRDAGIRVSLDDFGTGYTSLAMLADLPLDEVKLDRQFVSRARHHSADAAIAQAVALLGHRMNLMLVAEGVEDQLTGQLITEWGYNTVQGYLHSRPITATHIEQMLTDRHQPTPEPAAPAKTYDQPRRPQSQRVVS